jgi:hypothetical protein
MSTITVTNIKATGETASRAVSGVAAAWVNFNGDTTTIRDSSNVASITDVANGRHQLSFSNAMGDSNYAVTGNAGHSGFHNISTKSNAFGTVNSSTCPIRVTQTDNADDDDDAETSVIVHGDLA